MKGKVFSFGKSAFVLAAIGITAKLIGALYRVPLTNIVGAEGMGLYQMVFPLYTVLLAFCGGGMTSAVSRVVAKYTSIGADGTALRVLKVAVVPLIGISLVSAGAVALLRNVISGLQGNTDAGIAYLALCPSLIFAGGISVLRGYFQGKSNMLPSGISQLAEQSVKLALGLYLSKAFIRYGVKYAVAGALIGVSASEFAALAYLLIRFIIARKKRVSKVSAGRLALAETAAEFEVAHVAVTDRALMKELYAFALSVTLGALVLPVTQMIDSALVINLLIYGGAARSEATALFGLFVGPVGTLINMPTVVALSVAVAFLPAITAAVENKRDPSKITANAAKWILLFVIPVTVVFMLFPDRVCRTLYRRGLTDMQLATAARLLRIQSVSVFYIGVLQLATATLQGFNKAHRPVVNLVIGACVKVILTPLLVRAVGIYGAAAATAACFAVASTLTTACAYKCAPFGLDAVNAFIKPLFATLVSCGAFALTVYAVKSEVASYLWQTVIGAAAFVIVYGVAILLSGALGSSPFGAHEPRRNAEKQSK